MRVTRFFLGFLILALAGVIALSFLLSAPPAAIRLDADAGDALAAQWAALAAAPAGAPFELAAAPSEWAGWLAQRIADPQRSPLAGIAVNAGEGRVWLDVRLRGVFLFPTRLAVGFTAEPVADGLDFTCASLTLGRLRLPASLRARAASALDGAWGRWAQGWQIEQVEISAERIRVAGRRR